jgi:chromatin remodeling complex protein RSC6
MTRSSVSSKKQTATNAVVNNVVPTISVEPVVKTSRRGKKRVEEVVPEDQTVVVASTVTEENTIVENVDGVQVNEQIEFYAKLNHIMSLVSSLKKDYKTIEAKYSRDLKLAQKNTGKKKKRQGTRTPSGFVKPTAISDELANFLGKEKGCEMARTAVTKEINNYIVEHNLKDKDNGRKINPDQKLNNLLKVEDLSLIHISEPTRQP